MLVNRVEVWGVVGVSTEPLPESRSGWDLTEARSRPADTIAVAIGPADGGGFVFHAVQERQEQLTWSGSVQAPTPDAALLEVFCRLRAEIPVQHRIRFLVALPTGSALWQHLDELRAALPGCTVQGAAATDAEMMAAATNGLPPEWEPVQQSPADHLSLEPLTVATDGSVRGKCSGCGWLASDGQYGLRGLTHSREIIGTKVVLIAELRAIDDAVRRLANRELTLLCDSRFAIDMVRKWMDGADILPEGYTTDRSNGQRAGLVVARDRIYRYRQNLSLHWVKSHQGDLLNEGADALARLASRYALGDSGLSSTEYREC